MHAALSLVLCFVTSAAIWLLIEAEFLAVVLVLVYVGAVMVLFLFVVMMLDINVEELRSGFTRYAWLGWIDRRRRRVRDRRRRLGAQPGHRRDRRCAPLPADYSNTAELGTALYTEYVYPFELAAVLLLVAIVAAIALTMRKRAGLKVQDIGAQVAVRARGSRAHHQDASRRRHAGRRRAHDHARPAADAVRRSCSPSRWRASSSTART